MLMPRGGSGSDEHWTAEMWMWPLPPAGEVTFIARWADRQLHEAAHTVDAAQFVTAAADSEQIWDPGPEAGGSSGSTLIG